MAEDRLLISPTTGIWREDSARLRQALAGLEFPSVKWQVIDHVERNRARPEGRDRRIVELLWALPAGNYSNLAEVLHGAARTTRGHPRRTHSQRLTDR